jgi:hypothetical protein
MPVSLRPALHLGICLALSFCVLPSCKKRGVESGLRSAADPFNDGKYHGPNMSAKFCAENPAKCLCTLSNEFDTANYGPPEDQADRKEWFRQCIGQEVWYKATAESARFHAYFAQQRVGVALDWGWVLHTDDRTHRFDNWGFINDPDCCIPHSSSGANDGTCADPNITKDYTFGWDYCPGDDVLLQHVGNPQKDYTKADPACRIGQLESKIGAGIRPNGADDTSTARADSCHLGFGTSTGALGLRKFPNPRFDKERWLNLNEGSLWSWANFSRRQFPKPSGRYTNAPDYGDKDGKQRVEDFSVEPPFMVGETCGSCHIAFNPLNPPVDQNAPQWENIRGAVGNIYLRMTEVLGAGTPPGSLEHELFLHSRPGTVDTSAYTNDYVHNPGSFNAIINFDRRPGIINADVSRRVGAPFERFVERVTTYRRENGLNFQESTKNAKIPHVLKGGEDSIGPQGAVQRVYLNIFSCVETCMGNHLDDQRAIFGRFSRQTPFEFKQCQRDCPGYPAIEDRMWDIIDFLLHRRPTDLKDAKDSESVRGGVDGSKVIAKIKEKNGGKWYEDGRRVFGEKCAKCHSSHPGQSARAGLVEGSNVTSIDPGIFEANVDRLDEKGVRLDWLGSDVQIPQNIVKTYRCRALHSNHMEGHLWEAYASDTYRSSERYQPFDRALFDYPDEKLNASNLGGRGFYRNISLLSLWAHAPFMHNNALGYEFDHAFFDTDVGSREDWAKLRPDSSVKGRLRMFDESIKRLLEKEENRERGGKTTRIGHDINFVVGPVIPQIPDSFFQGDIEAIANLKELTRTLQTNHQAQVASLTNVLKIPKGTPVVAIHSLKHKQLTWDMMQAVKAERTFNGKLAASKKFLDKITGGRIDIDGDVTARTLIQNNYLHCADLIDNRGHEFVDFSGDERAKLIDFLKTL